MRQDGQEQGGKHFIPAAQRHPWAKGTEAADLSLFILNLSLSSAVVCVPGKAKSPCKQLWT